MQPPVGELLLVLLLCHAAPSPLLAARRHTREADSAFDELPDNSRLLVVDRLKRYPENERLIASIPSRIYEVIYPVQVRHHQKLGISTRDTTANKTNKHFHQTSLLIKAFHYKFRLELELNDYLLAPKMLQKHLHIDGIWQLSSQEVEHCYYHGTIKDYPGAVAAFRTCSGISGIIHIRNETFVIHPFYGGDLSRVHPHVIYKYFNVNKNPYICGNSRMHEWGFKHFRKTLPTLPRYKTRIQPRADKRDVREVYKFIELALVLDQAMFDARNSTRTEVMSDAIQIINCVDMYFRTVNTRVSIVYLETWATGDQVEHTTDIRQALLNFVDYSAKNLYKQAVDATHLLTGRHFPSREVGMAIPDTVCTAKAVGVSQDTNVYEPHLVASTVTHMLGHNLGMSHDDGGSCQCQDSWGCIMGPGILGTNHIQPYHFSSCSLEEYINALRIGHGICLFNKPGQVLLDCGDLQGPSSVPIHCTPLAPHGSTDEGVTKLEDFRTCGNGIKEQDEDCDCGTMEECAKTDPCCDPITCKLRVEANCSAGPCCENCKLRAAGQLCRIPESECDIPEFCDGHSGECPANIYKKAGQECKKGSGFCYRGKCHTSDEQCEFIWGFGARRSDEKCFGEFNVQGSMSGNCGPDGRNGYLKCSRDNMMCGTLQCQRGARAPIVLGMEKLYTRTIISIEGSEFECKVSTGSLSGDIPDIGIVWDGTKCGSSKICVNKSCLPVEHFRELGVCPSNNLALACSGHGVCSNVNTCYCDEGYLGPDCSQRANATEAPPALVPPPATDVMPPTPPTATDASSRSNKSSRTTSYVGRKDALSTPSLVIVLVSVVGGVFIFFALLATCYRRSTMPKLEQAPGAPKKGSTRHKAPMTAAKKEHEDAPGHHASTTLDSRIITFGSMPSYREDKLQELKRKEPDEADETFMELSPKDLAKDGGWPPLASATGGDTLSEVERTLKSLNGYHEEILEALHSASSHASPGQDSRRDLPRPEPCMADPAEPIRIRNLEDLLRQLEPGPLEPSGSERLSEPEADRHYLDGGSPYGLRYLLEDAYAQPDEDDEDDEESEDTGRGTEQQQQQQTGPTRRQRSASEEALPLAFPAGALPSPPSEESGSLEETFRPPPMLLPGPPPRRMRPKKKFPEYKMPPGDAHRRNYYK
ncbi:disintegrin and metalloproteinase domain-containing protein mind-meld isoform X1 [Rhipicephalus microplus]|uniref:disintegrin and metalloproteinase domain-containing protein mind-meld isoform X1 n=1 Tax=Rhipicephalus microplus TaxID=6941 RepID=UPI003F6D3987